MISFNQIKLIVIGLAVSAALASIAYYKHVADVNFDNYIAEIAVSAELRKEISTLNDTLNSFAEELERADAIYDEMSRLIAESNEKMIAKNEELRRYKDRQDVVFAKPGLVQRAEQKALDSFFDEVARGE